MDIEREITEHYAQKDRSEVEQGNDHLHVGGAHATKYFLEKLGLTPDMRALDIGCGVGGPALTAASEYGCFVTGIDITPEFIEIAKERNALGPHRDKLYFEVANMNGLNFKDASFDAAFMLHTGMNISDKQAGYNEVSRVLKPGSIFGIYDILALENIDNLEFPLPWSPSPHTSFVEPLSAIKDYLKNAGFEIESTENRQDYAIESIERMQEKMGDSLSEFRQIVISNLLSSIKHNACAPHIIIARKSS